MKVPSLKIFFLPVMLFIFVTAALAIEPVQAYQPKTAARLNQLLQKLGTGQDSLVAVRLKDNSVVSGYVSEVGPESFLVTNSDSEQTSLVRYSQVDRLQGANLSTGSEIYHGGGIRAKITRTLAFAIPGHTAPINGFSRSKTLIVGIVLGVLLAIILAKTL